MAIGHVTILKSVARSRHNLKRDFYLLPLLDESSFLQLLLDTLIDIRIHQSSKFTALSQIFGHELFRIDDSSDVVVQCREKSICFSTHVWYSNAELHDHVRASTRPGDPLKGGRFAVAGSLYPQSIAWPANIARTEHIPPQEHRSFYNSQKFTLNITRADMVRAGHSPSVRLFEAAACAVPIISDCWTGLSDLLKIGSEVLVVRNREEVLHLLQHTSAEERQAIGMRARSKIIRYHSYQVRARELDAYVRERLERAASLNDARIAAPRVVNA